MTKRQVLSIFSLMMITVTSVDNIRNLPSTALFGSQIIVFFFLGTLFFLLPTAFISAELAANDEHQSGVYGWVKSVFRSQTGFIAVWLQWISNAVYYPGLMAYIAGTFAYLISPTLANNTTYLIIFVVIVFWAVTILNLYGLRSSAWFTNLCGIFGLFLPVFLIFVMGIVWLISGKASHIHFTEHTALPTFNNWQMWVTITGVMLSLCGMEIATVHARETKNPQHAFPRALFLAVIIILATLIFGALTIAMVVPAEQLSLITGIMQSFDIFLVAFHAHWLLPLIGVTLLIGGLGGLNNWIIAPTKGLFIAGREGHLPKFLLKENRFGAPSSLLIFQAVIVSIFMCVFLLMPTINGSYWLVNVLSAQLYMLMYIMMFAAGIAFKFKTPKSSLIFQIPGGWIGTAIVGILGIIGSVATFIIGFIPPDSIKVGSVFRYDLLIVIGLAIAILLPCVSYLFKKNKKSH